MERYSINIAWSDEDKGYIATVPEFRNLSAFGETQEEALEEAHIVLEGYIEALKADNIPLPEPQSVADYSGQTRLRMPRGLHRALAIASQHEGVSLNTYMIMLLSTNYALNSVLKVSGRDGKHVLITYLEIRGVGSESTIRLPDPERASLGSISDKGESLSVE